MCHAADSFHLVVTSEPSEDGDLEADADSPDVEPGAETDQGERWDKSQCVSIQSRHVCFTKNSALL